jgi:hypothetical protein
MTVQREVKAASVFVHSFQVTRQRIASTIEMMTRPPTKNRVMQATTVAATAAE